MIGLRALLALGILCLVRGRVIVEKNVQAWVGSDAILKCTVKLSGGTETQEKVTQVTWWRNENGQNVDFLTFGEENKLRKLTPFAKSKVDYLGNEHTDGSIRIRDVSLNDESVYTCIFTIYPLGTFQNTTTLTVQAKPDVRVEPPPDPAVAKLPYQTVAICVAGAAKPAANITWWTDGLDYNSSERAFQNGNGTVTTESQLKMVPGAGIKDRIVTCIVSQGLALPQTEKKLNIQNLQYPPDSVRVEVRTLDNGAVQFICVEDSSPPATNFTWKRFTRFCTSGGEDIRQWGCPVYMFRRLKSTRYQLHMEKILLPVYMAACGLFLSSSWCWVPFFSGGTKIPEEREENEWKRVEPVDMGEPEVFR
ncbi:nectin-1-like isoform X5 [Aquarana catesbeiana]|uniref:nectin-1-like isoform X5 n=1 Tax=Aquarana catesbeiana TaxID=8400 RepID=UPI003CC9D72E